MILAYMERVDTEPSLTWNLKFDIIWYDEYWNRSVDILGVFKYGHSGRMRITKCHSFNTVMR